MKLKTKHLFLTGLILLLNASCNKDEPKPVDDGIDFSKCVIPGHNDKLEVVTFNMERFPLNGEETMKYVSKLLSQVDADVIALQEISTAENLKALAGRMPGWDYLFSPEKTWTMSLGYLYKTSEIELNEGETEALFTDDSYSFPRPPLKIKITHIPTGESLYIIDNHLKCCSGEDNVARRRSAAEKLKNYIDTNLPDDKVIVAGDMNDQIDGTTEDDNVFWNFIIDTANYRFADMGIATGNSLYWSYPSYPGHIDHLLITNECFNLVDTIFTIRADACAPDYEDVVSDHRPVELVLF